MKAVVVYDSFFGNTEKIARAVGEGISTAEEASVVQVNALQPESLEGIDLLVVGSPTRGFRPTQPINALVQRISIPGMKAAAFDTRIAVEDIHNLLLTVMAKLFGYAAAPIARGLAKHGGKLVLAPEGFFVQDTEGPLKDGELERAAAWGRKLTQA